MNRDRWKEKDRDRTPLRAGFTRNTGTAPRVKGDKRAIVVLMSGEIAGDQPLSTTTPVGWLVKTTRWSLTGWWHDVDQYKLV